MSTHDNGNDRERRKLNLLRHGRWWYTGPHEGVVGLDGTARARGVCRACRPLALNAMCVRSFLPLFVFVTMSGLRYDTAT